MIIDRFVVLAAVDTGAAAERTARAGANLARSVPGGELHLVHVLPALRAASTAVERANGLDATSILEDVESAMDALARDVGPVPKPTVCHVAVGEPWREILQMAARLEADLVLIGAHGRTTFQRAFLGSVAKHVVRSASCPVLVVREKDYGAMLAPEIEPPCGECVRVQRETRGDTLWCSQHQRHGHARPTGAGEHEPLFGSSWRIGA